MTKAENAGFEPSKIGRRGKVGQTLHHSEGRSGGQVTPRPGPFDTGALGQDFLAGETSGDW